ncbi:MAG: PPC domain-containing protein [Anaerolineae bacterium]
MPDPAVPDRRPVLGQQPTTVPVFPLKPGTIEGNLNDAAPVVRYSFDANADDSVSISMETTSGDLDPFLFLYAPDGTLVERNDDRESGNRNALIALTLVRRGTYIIEATRFEQASAPTSGTFRLTLTISGAQATGTPGDPLSAPPTFAVPFTIIDYQSVVAGSISDDAPQRFYAIGGQQGDLIRVIMTRTSGDLAPSLHVRGDRADDLSRSTQTRAGESIAYVTLPQTGWYLIEAGREADSAGTGGFDLYATRLAAAVLQVGQPQTAAFTPESPSLSYIVNARIGDALTVTMFTTDGASGVQPQLELLDLSLNTVERATGERFVTLRAPVPRSGIYIVRASNLNPNASGGFSLRLTSAPGVPFTAQSISYNNQYKGAITTGQPLSFYRFNGKTGELVTIAMNASSDPSGGDLNAYLILMDSDLNELAANDDVSTRRDARITQYRLPKDGEYVVLATRAGLSNGTTTGAYDLALTAGEISLNAGALTATLRWAGGADLNLFVRDPSGRTVSWSSPQVPSGGVLQIDSNTRCETPSDQPVEHVYWSSLVGGDYEVWAWYEDGCGINVSTEFTLDVRVNGTETLHTVDRLRTGQRYQVGLRVTDDGQGFVIDPGAIINPSPQQRASEGGDSVIRYGEALTGTISSEVYALFYQFAGAAGDQVTISAERLSGNLDPVIVLRDAADRPLPDGMNDDADATTQDARLTYTLPTDGTYSIAVTRYGVRNGTTTGDFRVSVGKY